MGRTAPITWDEITEDIRQEVIRSLMMRHRVSEDAASSAVNEAAGKLIKRNTVPRDLTALLVRTATNTLLDDKRQEARQRTFLGAVHPMDDSRRVSEDALPSAETDDPAVIVARDDDRADREKKVRAALGKLSEADRTLLMAYYFDNHSPSGTDRVAEGPASTTRSRVHRARKRLAKTLTSNGKSLMADTTNEL